MERFKGFLNDSVDTGKGRRLRSEILRAVPEGIILNPGCALYGFKEDRTPVAFDRLKGGHNNGLFIGAFFCLFVMKTELIGRLINSPLHSKVYVLDADGGFVSIARELGGTVIGRTAIDQVINGLPVIDCLNNERTDDLMNCRSSFIVYDLRDLCRGNDNSLCETGYKCLQDVRRRLNMNNVSGIDSFVYIEDLNLFAREDAAALFLNKAWGNAHMYNASFTGIVRYPDELLDTPMESVLQTPFRIVTTLPVEAVRAMKFPENMARLIADNDYRDAVFSYRDEYFRYGQLTAADTYLYKVCSGC